MLGLQLGGLVGIAMAVVALYTGVALWVLAWTIWPIVTDPERLLALVAAHFVLPSADRLEEPETMFVEGSEL